MSYMFCSKNCWLRKVCARSTAFGSLAAIGMAIVVLFQQPSAAQTVAVPPAAAPAAAGPSEMLLAPSELGTPVDLGTNATEASPTSFLGRWNPDTWFAPLERLPLTIVGFATVDSWRGLPDGHFQNNNGFKKGTNLGGLIPGLADWGIGAQLGASYGLYHTTGRASAPDAAGEFQQQTFVTAGFFAAPRRNFPWPPASSTTA